MTLSIHSPDELIAVIPHLLGFKPHESIVFVPMRSDLPVARVDLPTTPRDRELVWRSIRDGLTRYAKPGASVGIVCITGDWQMAHDVCTEFAARLDTSGSTPASCCGPMRAGGPTSTPATWASRPTPPASASPP
ncbi:hypothetical protein GCM10023350_11710 [Nocardioides endophyticus]|uniref:Uncharacterized protein n=1 Tax=Nocardioides endophyticus TaxID=1353775 RepID=A0ABP8YIG6_9ACTN